MTKQIVNLFIEAINQHNVEKIYSLMTDDHLLIDSQGHETAGKEKVRECWISYFQIFPDYNIEITDTLIKGEVVAALGFAGGTYQGQSDIKENYWHLPASWKAIIRNGKIDLWQVYADSKIPFDIINKNTNR